MKTTFDFNFDFYQGFKNMDTHKHGNKVTCLCLHVNLNLKELVINQPLYKYKNRPHSIDKNANHCS